MKTVILITEIGGRYIIEIKAEGLKMVGVIESREKLTKEKVREIFSSSMWGEVEIKFEKEGNDERN